MTTAQQQQPQFTDSFNSYVCPQDSIILDNIEGFTAVATIHYDEEYHIDNDDFHNIDQSVTGCNDEQQERLLAAREAWFNDEWFYCGVVVTVYKENIELGYASLWGIDANYPQSRQGNDYLLEVANELLLEALEEARKALPQLIKRLSN